MSSVRPDERRTDNPGTLNESSDGHDEGGGVYICRKIMHSHDCALRDLDEKCVSTSPSIPFELQSPLGVSSGLL